MRIRKTGPMIRMPTIADVLAVYVLVMVYVLLSSFSFQLEQARWINLLFPVGIAVLPVVYARIRGIHLPSAFPFKRVTLRNTVSALLLVPAVLVVMIPLLAFLKPLLPEDHTTDAAFLEEILSGGFLYAFLFIVVFPAVTEEVLFRGFILSGLRTRAGKWPAIVVCSLLFAALHLEPLKIVFTLLPGLVITIVAWKTRSLILPILMHCVHNGILFLLLWNTLA